MISETERNALDLAKRVFEHFTHDALPIAREIIAMEQSLGLMQIDSPTVDFIPEPLRDVTTADQSPVSDDEVTFPVEPIIPSEILHQDYSPVSNNNNEDSLPF
jgi:hypothetical protein